MSDKKDHSNEYEKIISSGTDLPEIPVVEEEHELDDVIYGKHKPRRETVDRRVAYDESK